MGINDYWVCPYNPAHVMVNNHRIQTHLAKCGKNYPNQQKKLCPFNATHYVPTCEYDSHLLNCPDNRPFLRDRIHVPNEFVPPPTTEPVPDSDYSLHSGGEVWGGSQSGRPGYDPSLGIKHKPIMRKPLPCAGKATQREFRKKDVERLERLQQGLPPEEETEEPKPKEQCEKPAKLPDLTSQKGQGRGACADISNTGHIRPFQYNTENRSGVIMGEIMEDDCGSAPLLYSAGRAGISAPDPASRLRGETIPSVLGLGRGGSLFRDDLPQDTCNEVPTFGFGRGRGRGNSLIRPGDCPVETPLNLRGPIRGYGVPTTRKEDQYDAKLPLNDFGSHDPYKLHDKYSERLSEIKAIKKRGQQGKEPTKDELELLQSEQDIIESLEKLNMES